MSSNKILQNQTTRLSTSRSLSDPTKPSGLTSSSAALPLTRPPRPTRTTLLETVRTALFAELKYQSSCLTLHCVGHPDEHAQAKEILAGAIGFFVDREVETKGLDFIDREKAKRHAQQQAEQELSNQYGSQW